MVVIGSMDNKHNFGTDIYSDRVERYYNNRVRDTWGGGNIMYGLQPTPQDIVLMSNDYLSIGAHPDIKNAIAKSALDIGSGLLMSGVFLHGDSDPTLALENRLGVWMGAESGILTTSGYTANVGLLQVIADNTVPVFIDMMAHASFIDGAKLAGATVHSFFHNDVNYLEKKILRYGRGIVITETIFSTSGHIAPLHDIVEVCNRHDCTLIVDESHSLGLFGRDGAGLAVAVGLADKITFRTASLAKAFVGRAGFIACDKKFCEYFKFEATPAIFSSMILPHDVSALEKALEIIKRDEWRRVKLHKNAEFLRNGFENIGYNLCGSESQIIPIEAGIEQETLKLRDAMQKRGLYGAPFIAPATPKNRSLIRLSIQAGMLEEEIFEVLDIMEEVKSEVDFDNWSSTKRLGRKSKVAA